MSSYHRFLLTLSIALFFATSMMQQAVAEFRAGAVSVEITPTMFPVLINGGMLSKSASKVNTPIHARAMVLDDGSTQMAIVVVDSCMMPRELLDEAKAKAAQSTGVPPENMLISATHTHSAPASMAALGTEADPRYPDFLRHLLVEAIERAARNLEPAKVGIAVANADSYTALRRWIRRPDRVLTDPFGNLTVRANMHPGYLSKDAIGPSGPEDPDLSVIGIQSQAGRPIGVLANFSMHYYSAAPISADYFGLFAQRIEQRLTSENRPANSAPVVGIMSHGTSGDIWLRDYTRPEPSKSPHDLLSYTEGLVEIAWQAYQSIEYQSDITLAMAQAELPLRYRTPDQQRLAWAQGVVQAMGDRSPKNTTEVYAREAIYLHEKQETKILLQALRIGSFGLTAIPNEVYALTGLKLKASSPLQPTVNIELANGAEGYIPPSEQHKLGGYNTWPARSAGLEVQAEAKIVETVLQLLERVAGKSRNLPTSDLGVATQAIVDSRPRVYWRMDEFGGPRAMDQLGFHDGIYETGVAFYLQGPRSDQFNRPGQFNRAAHFAGGRMRSHIGELGTTYSVSLWFWNGMPSDGRPITGVMFSRGREWAFAAAGEHLGIGGTEAHEGKLLFTQGGEQALTLSGKSVIPRWTWNHVVLVRDGLAVRVYLNGNPIPEISESAPKLSAVPQLFLGGRNDNDSNFEGKLDEIAIYDRALTPEEVSALYVPGN
ncbi:MAG: LamG-like jellyroll fold domain-containing protein [Pirellulales bacterium]